MIRWILLLSLVVLSGCNQDKTTHTLPAPSTQTVKAFGVNEFTTQVGIVAYTKLSLASQSAQVLDSKIAAFMHHPSQESHTAVQQAWRNAYDHFLASLIFSYLPIKDPSQWRSQGIGYEHLLMQLDSWPIEGGYIDYIAGYPFSGIVNDLTLTIDEKTLRTQHGFTDPSNASLGYHALEFMLWGGDGQRPSQDFVAQENTAPVPLTEAEQLLNHPHTETANFEASPQVATTIATGAEEATEVTEQATAVTTEENISEPTISPDTREEDSTANLESVTPMLEPQNHSRRRQYTQLLSELLLKDLLRIQRRWEPSSGYYAQVLQQQKPQPILLATFIAAQDLISKEILGKRFQLMSSEFSDSSRQDLLALLAGFDGWFMPEFEEARPEEERFEGVSLEGVSLEGKGSEKESAKKESISSLTSTEVVEKPASRIADISLLSLIQQADKKHAASFSSALQTTKDCVHTMTAAPSDIDQCKQETIQLLSSLRYAAKALAVNLPALD